TTVPASASTKKSMKSKLVVKKEKSTKVSEISPSVSNKSVDPFGTGNVESNIESNVDASVKETTVSNVEPSAKVLEQTEKSDVDKVMIETLDTSRSVTEEIVDATILPSADVNDQMDVSEKVFTGPIAES
ncbi:hypothetical protein A2U01_0052480, partial [Trifolium medium]|nr:hypothetical protein [Trifolium medium]